MRALAAVLLLACAGAAAAAPVENDAMSCPVPKGWRGSVAADGIRLFGPQDEGTSAVIFARWIAAGDPDIPDMDTFVARQLQPPLFEITHKTEDLGALKVAGRSARRLGRDDEERVAAGDAEPKPVDVREETVVVPAEKGFYVLTFRAAKSAFAARRRAFDAVLRGLRPRR